MRLNGKFVNVVNNSETTKPPQLLAWGCSSTLWGIRGRKSSCRFLPVLLAAAGGTGSPTEQIQIESM